jgi:hypothetical protein
MTQLSDPNAVPPALPPVAVPVISYAAPSYGAPTAGGAWRDRAVVILHISSALPDACVKCGGPPETRLKRNMSWYPPIAYIGLLAGLLPFAIAAIVMQKKATVMVPMCSQHLQTRKRNLLIAWGLALGGLAVAIGGPAIASPSVMIPVGIAVLIAGLIVGTIAANPLKPKKIDAQYAYLKGACEHFLNQLPDVHV